MTFTELLAKFPTEESCKAYLASKRWPDGAIRCPRCGNEKVFHVTHRPFHWICKSGSETVNTQTGEVVTCHKRNGYRFSVISGTIFENTNYKLRVWFQVMFLMAHSKKGMSALQIKRTIFSERASYETVWYMCTRIRAAMKDDNFSKLMGEVEVDETYIGGKNKNRHWSKKQGGRGPLHKTAVIGAISRKGNVTCQIIDNTSTETLSKFVRQAVSEKVDLVATDEGAGYQKLSQAFPHEHVDHKAHEYVRGNVHTNNIESFWSLLKRGIMGSYHKVSKEYLPLYIAEFTFRHNHRKDKDIFGSIVAGC
jgi:ISXO2 transposase-like protein/transposase-like zinc ribbon protein